MLGVAALCLCWWCVVCWEEDLSVFRVVTINRMLCVTSTDYSKLVRCRVFGALIFLYRAGAGNAFRVFRSCQESTGRAAVMMTTKYYYYY